MLALNLQRLGDPAPDAVDLCDVIIHCQCSDHQPIRAHRCVLATSSEYFYTHFMARIDISAHTTAVEVHLPFVSRDIAAKVSHAVVSTVTTDRQSHLHDILESSSTLRTLLAI